MDVRHSDSADTDHSGGRRGVVAGLVYVFEQVMWDPFVLSIGLTLVVSLLAVAFAPHHSLPTILTSWYDGTFKILGFALQMILILATGYAIADAPVVQRGLRAMAAGVPTPARAALLVFPIVAIGKAARQTGSMLVQYPVYGGIMGIMTGTGLASVIAKTFVAIATATTLPVWSFLSSLIITLLIPSAGGPWAVQGPFVLPAALSLHASVARTAMGVAMAENVSNMLQPFWAVPVVAIAGIRIQRVMGYTAITFVVSLLIYAAALWLIP